MFETSFGKSQCFDLQSHLFQLLVKGVKAALGYLVMQKSLDFSHLSCIQLL